MQSRFKTRYPYGQRAVFVKLLYFGERAPFGPLAILGKSHYPSARYGILPPSGHRLADKEDA